MADGNLMTQFQFIKQEINVLLDTGETSKKLMYNKLQVTTRLPRTTIRRCVRDFQIELTKKIQILSTKDYKRNPPMKINPYYFIPAHIRWHFNTLLKKNFIQVNCIICTKQLGYLETESKEPIICSGCRHMFPESKKEKAVKRLEQK